MSPIAGIEDQAQEAGTFLGSHQTWTGKINEADGDQLCGEVMAIIKDMPVDESIIAGVVLTVVPLVEK